MFNVQRSTFDVTPLTISQPLLPEAELRGAYAIAEDDRQWRATMQLIDKLERDAVQLAQGAVGNHGICAGFIGGAEWLARLRAEMIALRAAAVGKRNE